MHTLPLSFYTVVTGVGQCVLDELGEPGTLGCCEEQDGGGFRYFPHVPGDIAWDECQCGSFTQSSGPFLYSNDGREPAPFFGDANCGPFFIGVDVTALILRCAPSVTEAGASPDPGDLAAASRQWHEDAAALRQAVVCCLRELLDAGSIDNWQIVSQGPQGPQGGCVGSQLVYRVWLPYCEDCE